MDAATKLEKEIKNPGKLSRIEAARSIKLLDMKDGGENIGHQDKM